MVNLPIIRHDLVLRGARGCHVMSLMLSICTPDAVVLSTTSNHLTWLGRDRNGVVGHQCSEWAGPDHWDLNWHLFRHSLSTGMPMTWERPVVRKDGALCHGQVTVKPLLTKRHGLVAICINRVAADYSPVNLSADILRCLVEVGEVVPHIALQASLEELAAEAASVAAQAFGPLH
jgi:hypothetical protein